VQCNIDSEHA